MNSLVVAGFVVVLMFGCAELGACVRTRLPQDHLTDATKSIAMTGIGLLVTMSSLALSLLLGEAKSRCDVLSAEVRDVAVKIAMLDSELRDLGAAGTQARTELQALVASRIDALSGAQTNATLAARLAKSSEEVNSFRSTLASVEATGEARQQAKARAVQVFGEMRHARILAMVDESSDIVVPVLALIVAWFAVIISGLNVFAPRNGTIRAVSLVGAFAVAGAIFLILEMNNPFGGIIHVSDRPMRTVLANMQQ